MFQRKAVLLWLICALVSSGVYAATPHLKLGDSLASALDAYRALGLNVVSSSGMVTQRHRVTLFPDANHDLETQVLQLLGPHNLELKHLSENTWYVVRATPLVVQRQADQFTPANSQTLEPLTPVVEEIVVSANYLLSNLAKSRTHLDRRDLQAIPSAGGDILRAVGSLPGAANSGISASPRFRGGNSNEVLYLVDNIPVINPFHLRNFHSVFTSLNPNIVSGVEVFTSGFPAEFGGKSSSVIAIELLQPVSRFEGQVDINTLATSLHTGGTSLNLDWLISARRSTIDYLLSALETDYGRPRFHDELVRVQWSDQNRSVTLGAINTGENIQLSDENSGEDGFAKFDYSSFWVNVQSSIDTQWLGELQLVWLNANGEHSGELNRATDAVGQLEAETNYSVFSIQNKWTWYMYPDHRLEFGWAFQHQTGEFEFELSTVYGPLSLGIQSDASLNRMLEVERSSKVAGAYFSMTSILGESLTARYGLRYDSQDNDSAHKNRFSPRLQLSWAPGARWHVLLDWGRYIQHQNLFEIQVDDGLVELQAPKSTNALSLSLIHTWKNGNQFRADAYTSKVDDPWRRFDNLYNPWVLLPELHADRQEITPDKARMSGIELSLSHRRSDGWSWNAGYVLSYAREKIAGQWHSKPWDQRHALKLGLRYESPEWTASLHFSARSGWSTTQRLSLPEDTTNTLDSLLNETNLPAYLSLDLHLARRFPVKNFAAEIYLDVSNVLNRVNTGGYEYELEQGLWQRDAQKLLPVFPTLGLKMAW